MKTLTRICMICVGISLTLPVLAAKDPLKKAIKVRQGEMQLRSYSAGPMFDMAKGKIDYDAEKAQTLANNLVQLLEVDISDAWPKGSDNKAYPDLTTSLPVIWETYPEYLEYRKKYATAVRDLAAVAGQGRDALRGKVGALGKSCKGCHDEYREKK